jgi:hypothetical protein
MIIDRLSDGAPIQAMYMGKSYIGKVTYSRVKYGGRLQYSIALAEPTLVAGRSEPTDDILVYHEDILASS